MPLTSQVGSKSVFPSQTQEQAIAPKAAGKAAVHQDTFVAGDKNTAIPVPVAPAKANTETQADAHSHWDHFETFCKDLLSTTEQHIKNGTHTIEEGCEHMSKQVENFWKTHFEKQAAAADIPKA